MPVMEREPRMAIEVREVERRPFVAYCDVRNCYFVVSAKTAEQGQESLAKHNCKAGYSPHRIPDKTLLSAMWLELDACMDGIMLTKERPKRTKEDAIEADEKMAHYKARAGGIASCLFILLGGPPGYYPTQDDITRESVRRYKMRVGEMAWEPTQGDNYDALRDGATPRWVEVVAEMKRKGAASREGVNPPPNWSAPVPRARRAAPRPTAAAPAPLMVPPPMPVDVNPSAAGIPTVPGMAPDVTLPPDVIAGVKNGLKSGLFDDDTLAKMYGISPAMVATLKS